MALIGFIAFMLICLWLISDGDKWEMFRIINILLVIIIARGIWELSLYVGHDPIKSLLVCICAMIADAVYVLRNKR